MNLRRFLRRLPYWVEDVTAPLRSHRIAHVRVEPWAGRVTQTFALQKYSWWSLDSFLAPVILAALRQYKAADRMGYPTEYMPEPCRNGGREMTKWEEKVAAATWEADIDKMIIAFELIVNMDAVTGDATGAAAGYSVESMRVAEYAIEAGLALFAKSFQSLWD